MRGALRGGLLAVALAAAATAAGTAGAEAPSGSLLPQARPGAEAAAQAAQAAAPVGRPRSLLAVLDSLLPAARPRGLGAQGGAAPAVLHGQLCGVPGIEGDAAVQVRGGGGCGIESPVVVRAVDGVRLSTPATVDCTTAAALLRWVREGAKPALGGRGGGLAALEIAGSYACRPRNGQAGAKLSEHGLGRAVDVTAVVMADGSRLSVARDWGDPALRAMHGAACGIFSTTLGPGSDGAHEDHFHYDTARGRGPYCR